MDEYTIQQTLGILDIQYHHLQQYIKYNNKNKFTQEAYYQGLMTMAGVAISHNHSIQTFIGRDKKGNHFISELPF